MDNNAKIRINLNLREFEIEGSEDFINSHSEKIDSFLEILKSTPPSPSPTIVQQPVVVSTTQNLTPTSNGNVSLPESFGEYVHRLPKSAKDVDKVLIAGYFAQTQSTDGSFGTKDATALLLEQGIKVSNSSLAVTRNVDSKRIIKLAKGKFKLSRDGVDYLNGILNGISE